MQKSKTKAFKELVDKVGRGGFPVIEAKTIAEVQSLFPDLFPEASASPTSRIYEAIRSSLIMDDGESVEYITPIKEQTLLDIVLDKEVDKYYLLIDVVRDSCRGVKIAPLDHTDKWESAVSLCQAYLNISRHSPFVSYNTREASIGNAILKLRGRGFTCGTLDGKVDISDADLAKITDEIVRKASCVGGKKILEFCFKKLSPLYVSGQKRFKHVRQLSGLLPNKMAEAEIPYGYLIALGLRFYESVPTETDVEDFVSLVKAFACIHDIQKYSSYETLMLRDGDLLILQIVKHVKYDYAFAFPQYSSDSIKKIISSLLRFLETRAPTLPIRASKIEEFCDRSLALGPEKELEELQPSHLFDKITDQIRHLFGKGLSQIHQEIRGIGDLNKIEYTFNPFFDTQNGKMLFLPKPLSSIGYYEALMGWIRSNSFVSEPETFLGDFIEDFLKNLFLESGISAFLGKKYSINKTKRGELGIVSSEAECDLYVESETAIYFFEVKKKPLVRESFNGNFFEIANDIALSLLHSQKQLGQHELFLRKYGKICFTDKSVLELKGRTVERVSVSQLDFKSLQDTHFCRTIFEQFLGSKLSMSPGYKGKDSETKLKSFNKHMKEISRQFAYPEMKEVYDKERFFNIRWLSIFQIITICEDVENIDQFEKNFSKTRALTTGTCDWYFDFYFEQRLREKRDK